MARFRNVRVVLVSTLFLLFALALFAAACGGDEEAADGDGGNGSGALAGEIRIDGSSTVFPITEAMADEFGREHQDVRVSVGVSGTGGGMEKFGAGEIDIADASRPIKQEESEAVLATGVEYIELPIAYDGISVVVNPANDWVEQMTAEELATIWAPEAEGQILKWSDVNPDWPESDLKLYGPGTDSGTFDYFTDEIVGEEGASRGDFTPSEDDNVLVQGVAGDEGALGYFGFAYYVENQDSLRAVPIVNPETGEAVMPSEETINDGSYSPLSRPIFIYVSTAAAERPEVQAFVDFYLNEGQALISEVGYVPLPDEVIELVRERWENRVAGSMYLTVENAGELSLVELLQQSSGQ